MHMELAEWLVHWAPELDLPVQCAAWPSSMMYVIHYYKNQSYNYVAQKKKKGSSSRHFGARPGYYFSLFG